eukprot:3303548-Pyramimonas_sp.AAC.1
MHRSMDFEAFGVMMDATSPNATPSQDPCEYDSAEGLFIHPSRLLLSYSPSSARWIPEGRGKANLDYIPGRCCGRSSAAPQAIVRDQATATCSNQSP